MGTESKMFPVFWNKNNNEDLEKTIETCFPRYVCLAHVYTTALLGVAYSEFLYIEKGYPIDE